MNAPVTTCRSSIPDLPEAQNMISFVFGDLLSFDLHHLFNCSPEGALRIVEAGLDYNIFLVF